MAENAEVKNEYFLELKDLSTSKYSAPWFFRNYIYTTKNDIKSNKEISQISKFNSSHTHRKKKHHTDSHKSIESIIELIKTINPIHMHSNTQQQKHQYICKAKMYKWWSTEIKRNTQNQKRDLRQHNPRINGLGKFPWSCMQGNICYLQIKDCNIFVLLGKWETQAQMKNSAEFLY